MLPRRASPLTVRLLDGTIVDLMLGALSDSRVASLSVAKQPSR
jgi:hypothetical protein